MTGPKTHARRHHYNRGLRPVLVAPEDRAITRMFVITEIKAVEDTERRLVGIMICEARKPM